MRLRFPLLAGILWAFVPPSAAFAQSSGARSPNALPSSTGPLRTVRGYRSAAGSERVDSLRLVSPDTMVVVFSLRVDSLRAGDLLVAHGDVEVTNDCNYNVGLVTFMVLALSDTVVFRTSASMIAFAAGFNVSPNMHHGLSSRSGSIIVTEDMPTARVNFVAYAQSSLLTCRGIRVERNYGQLTVLHYSR